MNVRIILVIILVALLPTFSHPFGREVNWRKMTPLVFMNKGRSFLQEREEEEKTCVTLRTDFPEPKPKKHNHMCPIRAHLDYVIQPCDIEHK